jgi:hypothetical protein
VQLQTGLINAVESLCLSLYLYLVPLTASLHSCAIQHPMTWDMKHGTLDSESECKCVTDIGLQGEDVDVPHRLVEGVHVQRYEQYSVRSAI